MKRRRDFYAEHPSVDGKYWKQVCWTVQVTVWRELYSCIV